MFVVAWPYVSAGAAAASAASRAGRVGVHMVPAGRYCARVNNVQAYGEVNRDVSDKKGGVGLTQVHDTVSHTTRSLTTPVGCEDVVLAA